LKPTPQYGSIKGNISLEVDDAVSIISQSAVAHPIMDYQSTRLTSEVAVI